MKECSATGYVNVTGKISKPLNSHLGEFVETIEERAFEKALKKSGNIPMTVDHTQGMIAQTDDHTLYLEEDAFELIEIWDREENNVRCNLTPYRVVESARKDRIRGWSFGMKEVTYEMEERAEGQLPLRHVKDFILDHVTLVIQKTPCYAATSVECRANDEVSIMEYRTFDSEVINLAPAHEAKKEKIDYSDYKNRIEKLEKR